MDIILMCSHDTIFQKKSQSTDSQKINFFSVFKWSQFKLRQLKSNLTSAVFCFRKISTTK